MRIINKQIEIDGEIFDVTMKFLGLIKSEEIIKMYADNVVKIMKQKGEW